VQRVARQAIRDHDILMESNFLRRYTVRGE